MNFTKILNRKDGSQAKILVLGYPSPFLDKVPFEVCVYSRKSKNEQWDIITDTADRREKSKHMGVSEYVEKGRHPMFYVVKPIEILSAVSEFKNKFEI